jgi:hypothetical protein
MTSKTTTGTAHKGIGHLRGPYSTPKPPAPATPAAVPCPHDLDTPVLQRSCVDHIMPQVTLNINVWLLIPLVSLLTSLLVIWCEEHLSNITVLQRVAYIFPILFPSHSNSFDVNYFTPCIFACSITANQNGQHRIRCLYTCHQPKTESRLQQPTALPHPLTSPIYMKQIIKSRTMLR